MIKIEGLCVDFPNFCLKDINLSINRGDFFVLLGPTGSGKTLLLEAIAGLVPVKRGKIYINGIDVTNLPPENRGVSIVYQDLALFPHLTVLENIKYGLHFHKIDKVKAEKRLNWLLDQLKLRPLISRFPVNLSGGEMQRVALARALMINPSVLLLDEPLSSLDPIFKEEIRGQLKKLHQETGSTFLMVTHDFTDVLFIASRVAVINEGKIEQVGDVEEIFQKPRSRFVANFVEARNILCGYLTGSNNHRYIDTGRIKVEFAENTTENEKKVYFVIRPEDIIVSKIPLQSSARNCYLGKVTEITNRGAIIYLKVDVGNELTAMVTKASFEQMNIREGDSVYLTFKASAVHLF